MDRSATGARKRAYVDKDSEDDSITDPGRKKRVTLEDIVHLLPTLYQEHSADAAGREAEIRRELSAQVDDVKATLAARSTDVINLQAEVGNYRESLGARSEEVAALQEQLELQNTLRLISDAGLTASRQKVETLEQEVVSLEQQVASLQADIKSKDERFAIQDPLLAALKEKVERPGEPESAKEERHAGERESASAVSEESCFSCASVIHMDLGLRAKSFLES